MNSNRRLTRHFADLTCRLLQAVLPDHLRPWGDAIRADVTHIPGDREALLYALGGLRGLLPRALAAHLSSPIDDIQSRRQSSSRGVTHMPKAQAGRFRPRRVAVACAASAVLLGLFYLASAGAPLRYLLINGMAFLIGFAALAVMDRLVGASGMWRLVFAAATAAALLVTALLGQQVEGAARWVRVGALSVQPSLILLPLMILTFDRTRNWLTAVSVIVGAAALAIQPDRAMAGMLAVGIVTTAALRPDRIALTTAAAAVAGFAAALARPDHLPAVPFVDGILYSAFEIHLLAGAAVLGGSLLLLVPAIIGWFRDHGNRTAHATLGMTWATAILAAALGNYPTPLVGYGGSAIIGYLLCLAALPKVAAIERVLERPNATGADMPPAGEPRLRAARSA